MALGKQNRKMQSLLQLALFAGILLFINILANARIGGRALYTYFDMTEEKRFTLTGPTRDLLEELDDVVTVKILLEGDFPAGFKRLQTAARDILDDFRAESGYIEYEFENPREGSTEEINARTQELAKDGIIPVNLTVRSSGEKEQKLIYPYAIVYFKGRTLPVRLLENEVPGMPPDVILNNSVGLLEYKFANAIQKLRNPRKPPVVFTTGHGELHPLETADLEKDLRAFYETGRIHLDSVVALSPEIAVLIIAKPTQPFSEKDKFKIDQYVMNGGKVLWLMDALRVDLDSLQRHREYVPIEYDLNLDDLLFRYGIRIQPNMVLDMQCSRIPLVVGQVGNAPQFEYERYPYHPVVTPASGHPVVKSLAPVNLFYPSTIDTKVRTKTDVRKTILLQSSPHSRLQYPPVRMNFDFLRYDLDPDQFNKGPQPVAMLLEGVFPSMYENRVTANMLAGLRELDISFRKESPPTSMIVVSDGDVARNPVNWEKQSFDPLGWNPYEQYQFANKDFVINAIEYLVDRQGVIEARAKEVKLRMLDTARARAERIRWQLLNIAAPLVFLILFGVAYNRVRRWRYGKGLKD
jgi:ABC-2 type transport system permease protein